MSNTNPKYEGRSLEDLKSSLRAVNHKIDDINMEAAVIMGILPLPEGKPFWIAGEIDWNSPKLDHLRETFFKLVDESYELTQYVGRLQAEKEGNLDVWNAEQKGLKFLKEHFNSFEEEVSFFKRNNLVRGFSSLTEELLKNPNFLVEVEL